MAGGFDPFLARDRAFYLPRRNADRAYCQHGHPYRADTAQNLKQGHGGPRFLSAVSEGEGRSV